MQLRTFCLRAHYHPMAPKCCKTNKRRSTVSVLLHPHVQLASAAQLLTSRNLFSCRNWLFSNCVCCTKRMASLKIDSLSVLGSLLGSTILASSANLHKKCPQLS